MSDKEVLVKCEHVSKKFCLDFKQSLVYGLKDVLAFGVSKKNQHHDRLRDKEFWAVKDINFEIRRGECLGLIGHNGAGKSTLLKMLNGLINPDQGKIIMRGRIGALIELGAGFNPLLTGRENIYSNGAVLGFSKEEIDQKIDKIIAFSEIEDFIDSPVQNYSSGMKVRLGFAVAAQMEPDILLIDEVLAVGDLGFVIKCLNRMGELIPNCATIFVSHSMQMVSRICNQILLMEKGRSKLCTNDISEGIKQYVDLFDSPEKTNQGNGEVELQAIRIKDPQKQGFVTNNFVTLSTSDDLELELTLKVSKSVSVFDLFVIAFDGQLREALSSVSGDTNDSFENNEDTVKKIYVTIPGIVLSSGKYSITIGAENPKTKQFYCRVTNAIYFNMKSIGNTWATSLVPGKWNESITVEV